MKQLKQNLSVEKLKETQYTGGNICVSSCGTYLFCIYGSSVNIIQINNGTTLHVLESEEEEITSIALSPDDKHLITAHRNLLLKQWDNWNQFSTSSQSETTENSNTKTTHSSTSKCTRTWKAIHLAPVLFMCFDSSSCFLATASSDYTTKIWDIEAQYCTHNLKGAQGIIRCVRFHPCIEKSQTCITGSDDSKLRVYNLNTSQLEACLEGHFSSITCFEFINYNQTDSSQDEYKHLISSSRDKVLIIWDLSNYTKLRTIPIYESIESFFLVSNLFNNTTNDLSRYVITAGNQGLLKLWDLKISKIVLKQNESDSLKIVNKKRTVDADLEQVIIQCLYIKSLNSLVLVTIDQLIVFVRLDSSYLKDYLSNDPNELLLDSNENENERTFNVYKQFIGDHGEILDSQLLNSNENLLALATNNELIKIYNLDTWDCKLLKGHDDLVICLSVYDGKLKGAAALDADEKNLSVDYLASSSKDSTIRIWKIVKKEETPAVSINGQSSDSSHTSSSSSLDHKIECVSVCYGHSQDVGALCFSKLGFDFLVSASIDTTLKLWKITRRKNESKLDLSVVFTIKAHEKDINSVSVSPNDKLIVSGSSDKTAKIWNSSDGSCLAILKGHKRGIWCAQFSSVDQLVATSSADATIKLWSLSDFSCVKTFEGHNTSVLKVYFLNNGTQLVSSASDGLLKLWNIKTNECVGTFDEHNDKTWALCLSKDENRIISGGADGKLIVWKDVTEEKLEEELEKRQEILLKEQELNNYLKEKKWKKALGLAILLNKPFKCYEIIKEILQQNNKFNSTNGCIDDSTLDSGKLDLEKTLNKLREDQIKTLLKYANDWNTNTKFCHLAQTLIELILRNNPPELIIDESNNYEFSSKLIEQFLPYSERHLARVNKLAQQIMFIDFAWSNMKLEDQNLNKFN